MSELEVTDDRWLLPEGIEEILPEQAKILESARRELLDTYESWGYELVITPMMEYLESLQAGTGKDLDLQTLKVIDSQNGRMMGIRADITPQAARIDAHSLNRTTPTRLCYLGTVLHAYPNSLGGSRSPMQVGAELYGHAGVESDIEVIELMLETMKLLGIKNYHLDLGHVAIYRDLAKQAGLDTRQEMELFEALQRKAIPDINRLLTEWKVDNRMHTRLSSLAKLSGGVEALNQAKTLLSNAGETVNTALEELEKIAIKVNQRRPEVPIHFDMSELRAYNYQSGVVFAVYVSEHGQEIARGGRYDEISKDIGGSRPATGFSADLKTLLNISSKTQVKRSNQKTIFAPYGDDESLQDMIVALRATGEKVISELPGQKGDAQDLGCNHILVQKEGEWEIQAIKKKR